MYLVVSAVADNLKHIIGVGLGFLLGLGDGEWRLFVLLAGAELVGTGLLLHEGADEKGIGSSGKC